MPFVMTRNRSSRRDAPAMSRLRFDSALSRFATRRDRRHEVARVDRAGQQSGRVVQETEYVAAGGDATQDQYAGDRLARRVPRSAFRYVPAAERRRPMPHHPVDDMVVARVGGPPDRMDVRRRCCPQAQAVGFHHIGTTGMTPRRLDHHGHRPRERIAEPHRGGHSGEQRGECVPSSGRPRLIERFWFRRPTWCRWAAGNEPHDRPAAWGHGPAIAPPDTGVVMKK